MTLFADAVAQAIAVANGGIWVLVAGVFAAGLVRGFSGFGTAMVYLPVAAQFLSPFEALTTLIIMDMIGPLPHMRRALRDGHPRDVMRLSLGALAALPLGVWLLGLIAPETFRYGVSLIALLLLVTLIAGLRYRGRLTVPVIYGTGALGGVLAGSVGLPGPPVIMLYMASSHPAAVIRANTMLYLLVVDVLLLGVLQINGYLVLSAVTLGLLLVPSYLVGNILGGWMFRPGFERLYRAIAYLVIATSAVSGLPLFD